MVKQNHALLRAKPLSTHTLYDAYAGMLLGYIFEVVKDHKIAEDYLVKTFSSIAKNFNDVNWDEINIWCQLQRFAKNELTAFHKAIDGYEVPAGDTPATLPNLYLDRMTDEQKLVFCNIYYSNKTTTQLAEEINRPEKHIKQLLKEAFAIIRKSHEH
ncbi:sigma factor-like helix-turn-helix DNA-binding protein [Mucilaginibacter sp. dw_454]|uniref:RNA polymerase sigma factor n=1 Tax=Mucilaginibacter sp. dw_454 TaxID=2720079 RepID=UPI001BD63BF6|nr:sigma factor-like helix-turn-helix DNA-binding protein [Mucilaginibacter sp. dw_454]